MIFALLWLVSLLQAKDISYPELDACPAKVNCLSLVATGFPDCTATKFVDTATTSDTAPIDFTCPPAN
jgi:hypothetical protein